MRCWMMAGAFALAIGLAASSAKAESIIAQPSDGSALAALCRASDRTFCYGYVTAAAQFYEALLHHETLDPFGCPGREVTQQEAVAVFLDWYAANTEAESEPAIDALFRSWIGAFPCE